MPKDIELGELVRDLTKVGSIPKSHARKRILEYCQKQVEAERIKAIEEVRDLLETKWNDEVIEKNGSWTHFKAIDAIENFLNKIKKNV